MAADHAPASGEITMSLERAAHERNTHVFVSSERLDGETQNLSTSASVDWQDLGSTLPNDLLSSEQYSKPAPLLRQRTESLSGEMSLTPALSHVFSPWQSTPKHLPGLRQDSPSWLATMSPSPERSLGPARTMVHRSGMQPGVRPNVELIRQMLKSYAVSMMRDTSLPPFIHSTLAYGGLALDDDNVEPLTNCMNLMRMLGAGLRGGAKLFWRNVQMECERFDARVSKPMNLMSCWVPLYADQRPLARVYGKMGAACGHASRCHVCACPSVRR
jgi:hypothetical protein